MIKWIMKILTKKRIDPVEKYLSESVDMVDLERRQRHLQQKGIWV